MMSVMLDGILTASAHRCQPCPSEIGSARDVARRGSGGSSPNKKKNAENKILCLKLSAQLKESNENLNWSSLELILKGSIRLAETACRFALFPCAIGNRC